MRRVNMLIVMTTLVLVAAGSVRASTSPRQLRLDIAAVMSSSSPALPAVSGDDNVSKRIFPAARNSTIGQLFVMSIAEDGKDDDDKDKNPKSRSAHCPPDKDDHHDFSYRDDDHKGGDDHDKDKDKDKDKDHHEKCGKGDDDKNP
jgi:hypothetical protein